MWMTARPRWPALVWVAHSWWPRSVALSTSSSRSRPLGFGRIGAQRLLQHGRALGAGLVMVAGSKLIVSWVRGHPLLQLPRRRIVARRRRDLQGGAAVGAIRDARVRPGVREQRL